MAETAEILLEQRLRPLRLAILVPPRDRKAIRRAIEVSSGLWGGIYNCIVPAYKSSTVWHDGISLSPSRLLTGYLSVFEPDYIVAATKGLLCHASSLPTGQRLLLRDVLSARDGSGCCLGVHIKAVMNDLYRSRFRYVQRERQDAALLRAQEAGMDLLVSATFGRYPNSQLRRDFRKVFEAKDERIAGPRYAELVAGPSELVPFSICKYRLKPGPDMPLRLSAATLFYMDAKDPRDIVDFWNLRALGRSVIPLPKQWLGEMRKALGPLLASYPRRPPQCPNIEVHIAAVAGRSVSEDEMMDFRRVFADTRLTFDYYPTIWQGRGADGMGVARTNFYEKTGNSYCAVRDSTIEFHEDPPEILKHADSWQHRWAHVLNFEGYTEGTELAFVYPPELVDTGSVIGPLDSMKCSITSEGLTRTSWRVPSSQRWRLPNHQTVIQRLFEGRGYEASLSDAGRVAHELQRRLGGLPGTRLLIDRRLELIKTLNRMAQGMVASPIAEGQQRKRQIGTRYLKAKELTKLLKKLHDNNQRATDGHFRKLEAVSKA